MVELEFRSTWEHGKGFCGSRARNQTHAIAPSPYATHRYLEEDNLAVLPEGGLDFAFCRALGDVGDVQC